MESQPQYGHDNVFEFRSSECKTISKLTEALKENMNDVDFYLFRDGLKCYAMDNSQTMIINVSLDAEEFDHYYCNSQFDDDGKEIPIIITLSAHNLNKVMKTVNNGDDTVIWILNYTQHRGTQKLQIYINCSSK